MERFLERHQNRVVGVVSGFDRVLFQGTLRSLSYLNGLEAFLATFRVLYKDFGSFWQGLSEQLKARAHAMAEEYGRPFQYLESSAVSKEALAQEIRDRDGIRGG